MKWVLNDSSSEQFITFIPVGAGHCLVFKCFGVCTVPFKDLSSVRFSFKEINTLFLEFK